ncbi:MAG TPA: hypothetical protein VGC41_17565 [Kofleriaceae bacterium]
MRSLLTICLVACAGKSPQPQPIANTPPPPPVANDPSSATDYLQALTSLRDNLCFCATRDCGYVTISQVQAYERSHPTPQMTSAQTKELVGLHHEFKGCYATILEATEP